MSAPPEAIPEADEVTLEEDPSESPADLEWEQQVHHAQFEALPTLRSSADKWTATVGTLVGLFGTAVLVAGPKTITDVSPAARGWLAGLVVLTVVAATVAVALASLAAQGGSKSIMPTGPEYRRLMSEEVHRARNLLAASRWITIGGVLGLLALTVLVAMLNPKPDQSAEQNVLVTYLAGGAARQVCGTLQPASDGIVVREGRGKADTALPLPTVISIAPVPTCPVGSST
jgi:hypothetical protein